MLLGSMLLSLLFASFLIVHEPYHGGAYASAIHMPTLIHHAPILRGHSHNDYEQELPLVDALSNHFYSVEADIWLVDGKIQVSHMGWFFRGTLEELYLEPMQRIVSQQGSMYHDDRPFMLWLDIKDDNPELLTVLQGLLSKYPMLTRFTNTGEVKRPVTAVMTGSNLKSDYVSRFPVRYASRDSLQFHEEDPPADSRWNWYALKWSDFIDWDGEGVFPEAQKIKLLHLVTSIHAKGRKLRFWGAPDTSGIWAAAYTAGVDLISTNLLQGLGQFMDSRRFGTALM
jgi:hypothetical protein